MIKLKRRDTWRYNNKISLFADGFSRRGGQEQVEVDPLAITPSDLLENSIAYQDVVIKQEVQPLWPDNQPSSNQIDFLSKTEMSIRLADNSTAKIKIFAPLFEPQTSELNYFNANEESKLVTGSFKTNNFVFQFTSTVSDSSNSCVSPEDENNLVIDIKPECENSSESSTNLRTPTKVNKKVRAVKPYKNVDKVQPDIEVESKNKKRVPKAKICEHCGETFNTPSKLLCHLNRLNCCRFCFTSHESKSELQSHIKDYHNIKKLSTVPQCDMCFTQFETTNITKAHMKEFNCGLNKCRHCNVKMESRSEYEQHIMDIHTCDKVCPFCDVTLQRKSKLKRHYFRHTLLKLKLFLCPHCNVRYTCKTNFRAHKCPAAKNLACEKCNYAFINYQEHDEHLEVCKNMIIYDSRYKNKHHKRVYARNIIPFN